MKKLLKYEFFYYIKTSKFIVFGAIFILFSIISPLTAKYIQELISFLLNGESLPIDIPDPTVFTAYEQYIGDLYEIIFTVTLFVGVSIFIRDKTKNLLPQIFSKPINRTKYVISKYISFLTLILVSLTFGYLVFSYYTYFLFDDVFFVKGIWMMLLYFLDIMFVSAIALFSATYFRTYIPAMLVTWGIYILSGLVTIAEKVPVLKHFPGMIKSNIVNILLDSTTTADIVWNIIVTLALIGLLIGFTIRKIRNQDI